MNYERPDVALFLTATPTNPAPTTNVCLYRCTCPNAYPSTSPGHKDPSARQGYYIEATSALAATHRMREAFPTDTHFDVQLYRDASGKRVYPTTNHNSAY